MAEAERVEDTRTSADDQETDDRAAKKLKK